MIQRALKFQTPLDIVYYSPYLDETTTRLIEPLRLEYRDDIAYLVAYCHLAGDEHTFRVERILQLAPHETASAHRRNTARKQKRAISEDRPDVIENIAVDKL